MIAWQLAFALQEPKQELATVLCQLDQGKTVMNTCKSALVRFLQG